MPTTYRSDPLAAVHKALRRLMFDTWVRSGAIDLADEREIAQRCADIARLLQLLAEPAEALREAMAQLQQGAPATRAGAAARVYRELGLLVTARLQRLAEDEALCTPLLLAQYGDEELAALRRRRLAWLSREELRDAVAWMSGALSPQELAELLADLHEGAPAAALRSALEVLGRELGAERWQQLARALRGTRVAACEELRLAA